MENTNMKYRFERSWKARQGSLSVILRQLRDTEDFQLRNDKMKTVF